ncbi:hypothetical protein D1BOALGB6SA_7216 [Olavius sp. associated proteobacterium Delta 1]|nr:hypothetical protein D1BOALGB6SA_7216 [Olavius sp. associated proteobacterium Delta 1]
MSTRGITSHDPKNLAQKQMTYPPSRSSDLTATPTQPVPVIQTSRLNPTIMNPRNVMQLQKTIGNRATGKLLSKSGGHSSNRASVSPSSNSKPLQARLTVTPAGDKYEQEADQVAKQVVNRITSPAPQPVQRQEPEEEELQMKPIRRQPEEEKEILQGKFKTDVIQRQLPKEGEKLLQKKFNPIQRQGPEEEEELVQGKFKTCPTDTVQVKSNAPKNTAGMPDHLKSGLENLSGISMSNVKVHYNSSKLAPTNAHAFTQGKNIHIASGQIKHLPHEGWHVVQQWQGRVKPTIQMKGVILTNDDQGLEKEADVLVPKAINENEQFRDNERTDTQQLKYSRARNSDPFFALIKEYPGPKRRADDLCRSAALDWRTSKKGITVTSKDWYVVRRSGVGPTSTGVVQRKLFILEAGDSKKDYTKGLYEDLLKLKESTLEKIKKVLPSTKIAEKIYNKLNEWAKNKEKHRAFTTWEAAIKVALKDLNEEKEVAKKTVMEEEEEEELMAPPPPKELTELEKTELKKKEEKKKEKRDSNRKKLFSLSLKKGKTREKRMKDKKELSLKEQEKQKRKFYYELFSTELENDPYNLSDLFKEKTVKAPVTGSFLGYGMGGEYRNVIMEGMIFAITNKHLLSPKGKNLLRNSEVMYQQYKKMKPGKNPLKSLFRVGVGSIRGLAVKETINNELKEISKELTFKKGNDYYYAILGTENGAAAQGLVLDHGKELEIGGIKEIKLHNNSDFEFVFEKFEDK